MRTRSVAIYWNLARLGFAVLIAGAIIAQFEVSISSAREFDRDVGTTIGNFFSFFTILSNLSAKVFLVWSSVAGLRALRSDREESCWLSTATMASSTYMIVTGIVYNGLLRGIELPQGTTVPWSNEVLHLVGPLFMLADIVLAPRRGRLPWSTVWAIIAFPIVWLVYTLIRGSLVTNPQTGQAWWYPYPFLDPHQVTGGWWGVTAYVVGVAVVITAVAVIVVAVARRLADAATRETLRANS